MKFLVSDYDETFRTYSLSGDLYVLRNTIQQLGEFMKCGNKFMIATTRPYNSIMDEVNRYNIPYDFISTLNGCIIHDNSCNVIYSKEIVPLDVEQLCRLYSCIKKVEQIKDGDKLLYYILKTKLFDSSKELFNYLRMSRFDVQSWFLNTYNIAHPISNKIDSVIYIQNLLGICDNDVITIGDAKDDLEMIKKYYSYGIIKLIPNFDILSNCDRKVKSLNHAFRYINKNT